MPQARAAIAAVWLPVASALWPAVSLSLERALVVEASITDVCEDGGGGDRVSRGGGDCDGGEGGGGTPTADGGGGAGGG